MDNRAIAELGHRENHCAPAVAFTEVFNSIAVAYQTIMLAVYYPLKCISEESVGVIKYDGLYQLGLASQRDALYEADVLHAFVALLGTLRHIEQRKHVGLVVALSTKEGDVGMIFACMACQWELA